MPTQVRHTRQVIQVATVTASSLCSITYLLTHQLLHLGLQLLREQKKLKNLLNNKR